LVVGIFILKHRRACNERHNILKRMMPHWRPVRKVPGQVEGFDVVALNVTRLRSDNLDPREYMDRLEDWQRRVEEGGGTWRLINDMARLERMLGGPA
jgi:hypothetical protein